MTEKKKHKKNKKKKIERTTPNFDSMFAKINALREQLDYSKVITDPRGSRKPWSDIAH